MPDNTCRRNRGGLRSALLWGVLGLALALPTTVWAAGHTIKVRPPSGVDDTATIQAALDAAVTSGPDSTVQLAAGRYLTQQLAVYNFHGTFKGMGKDRTTIEALPNLQVTPGFGNSPVLPNGTTNRWPSLVIFVDGDIRVSDLSIKVTAPPGTAAATWLLDDSPVNFLLDAIRIMGTTKTNVCVEGISIEGLPDDSPTSWGFNVVNGVYFAGELARSTVDLDYYHLSGSFTVRNTSMKSTGTGAAVGGYIQDANVTIGGSPAAGNVFENALVGLDIEGGQNSHFEISHNRSEGMWYSMWVASWLGVSQAIPAHYSIHDNTFITIGPSASFGIYLPDDPAKPWIRATIFNNTIEQKSDSLWAGIGAYDTMDTVLWNNTITGSGAAAIQLGGDLGGDALCTVLDNHIRGFYADPSFGLAQIHLGPATSHNLVVCSSPLDTVLNQGTKNIIIGGWPQSTTAVESPRLMATPASPAAHPEFMKRKLHFRR